MAKAKEAKIFKRAADSEVEVGYQKPSEPPVAALKQVKTKDLKSRAERLAKDFEFQGGWKFREAEKYFPDEPWMRTVDQYFPHAVGGPLLVDHAELPQELARCERKQAVLEGLGYRYIILQPNKTEADDFMELEKCGQRLKTA